MRHLFEQWEEIGGRIQQSAGLFLFLDYDGTLTPIVPRPEMAVCPPEVSRLLEKLSSLPGVVVAIVSGRPLDDLWSQVGIPGILYVGNHGMEIRNPAGVHKKRLSAVRAREFQVIEESLKGSLGEIPGILFEDKGPILSVHYRNVARRYFVRIQQALKETLRKWRGRWKMVRGKMVVEIRPEVDFHKGRAVRELLKGSPARLLSIFLGDDPLDEDAFRELKGRGISVLVAPRPLPSQADYYLHDPWEVQEFLRRCEEILRLGRGFPQAV